MYSFYLVRRADGLVLRNNLLVRRVTHSFGGDKDERFFELLQCFLTVILKFDAPFGKCFLPTTSSKTVADVF